jgi:hypothetical protein
MTNPTTFFNWQMPENTSLVTDLPADFEVFGQAVDTDFQDLLGGTTGQVLSKTSGTDLDFTWVDPTAGDITGVTAGTGISGGGTSGTVTVTNSMATAIDSKGDLIAGTADDTFDRLAVGANDTILTADSSTATGLKWATPASGGMTSLATGSLSSLSTLDLTSISQSYIHLQLVLIDWELSADSNVYFRVNNESNNNYFMSGITGINSGSTTTTALFSKNIDSLVYLTGAAADAGAYRNLTVVDVFNYTSTIFAFGTINSQSKRSTGADELFSSQWTYNRSINNAPITELNLLLDTGNFTNGTYVLYGVK